MKKNARKLLSIMMAAVLLIGMSVVGVSAADDTVITGTFTYMPAFTDGPATETFYYSDSWLTAPSATQNTRLTTMSMALAYASMEIEGSSYITDLYSKIGFDEVRIDDMNGTPTTDTIGTAIAHKTIDGQDVIAVSIRGNKYGAEWAANLRAGAFGDIEGFAKASEKVIARIKAYREAHHLSNVKLWIAGYSAAADLAGVYINEHLDEFDTTADDVFVYCYEAPRCCASDTVYPNIYCIKNKNDLINYVYPASWGVYTNGVEIVTGEDLTVNKVKVDVVGYEKIVSLGAGDMDDFNADLIDFIADELTRKKFSGEFDIAASNLIALYFSASSEAWNAVFNSLQGSLSELVNNPRTRYILTEEVQFGAMQHNSDAMYRQIADELKILLQEIVPAESLPISAQEYQEMLDSVYPLIRVLGPVLVKDYRYQEGIDYSTALPADYDDPTYDPQTAEEKILTYDQSVEAEQNQTEDPEEPEEPQTDAGQGEEDGRSDGYDRGYEDGFAGKEPLTEAPIPADAQSHSQEYLEAYRAGFMSAYEDAYEYGYKDANPEYSKDYYRGVDDADKQVGIDAKKDALAQSYKASYNEEPAPQADGTPYSQDYLEGYYSRYRQYYDGYYQTYTNYFKEQNLVHFATLFVNREAILRQHYPQTNWTLVTLLDPHYQLRGDANLDGAVDITDATTIQRYDVKLIDLNETALTLADVNEDGDVSIIDATWIQRFEAGMKAPAGIGQPIA